MVNLLGILRSGVVFLLLMTVLLGGIYPMLVTGLAQAVFPHQANGSLIERDGKVIGSELIGQAFDNEWYFWSRLSATNPPYNGAASRAYNLGPASPLLMDEVLGRASQLQKADPQNRTTIPVDLVTSSASGLDPHISVDAANYQLPRVAAARHMSKDAVQKLIETHTESFAFGRVIRPYVNVLKLNLALDTQAKPSGKR
jgi:potassium-transporting ATPase KdpC subunit